MLELTLKEARTIKVGDIKAELLAGENVAILELQHMQETRGRHRAFVISAKNWDGPEQSVPSITATQLKTSILETMDGDAVIGWRFGRSRERYGWLVKATPENKQRFGL
jgi:hypothetical protein